MFTGIIEEIGAVARKDRRGNFQKLVLKANKVLQSMKIGDSINVSGVCQTVVDIGDSTFSVESVEETLLRTTLGELQIGQEVNLERAISPTDRFGGHFVMGHVDGVGRVIYRTGSVNNIVFHVSLPPGLAQYVASKGSIAVDGVSLTVVSVALTDFSVSIIPFTLHNTTLGSRKVGDGVNIEVDILARYVERTFKTNYRTNDHITENWLDELNIRTED